MKEADIVIVGGGICGLATALALHRKGIKSKVLEKHKTPRVTGTAIIMQANGWRALDQLGIASKLREKYTLLNWGRYISLETGKQQEDVYVRKEEMRCVKRKHLIQLMIDSLPSDTIIWNHEVLSIKLESDTLYPIIELKNGSYLKAKVVIGCDGVNSVIADYLGHRSMKTFEHCVIRGFRKFRTNQHNGFVRDGFSVYSHGTLRFGWFPMTNNSIYWFMARKSNPNDDVAVAKDPILLRDTTLAALHQKGFPKEAKELVQHSDLSQMYLTQFKYRSPWDFIVQTREQKRKGCVVLAGDAMHAMAPFIAQGGAAALEDAVVLARCLAAKQSQQHPEDGNNKTREAAALNRYENERRIRVLKLSFNNYLHGMLDSTSSGFVKFICRLLLAIFFPNFNRLTDYDCGQL